MKGIKKELRYVLSLLLLLTVVTGGVFAVNVSATEAEITMISEVEGTVEGLDISYGESLTKPTFKMTKGLPATISGGQWQKMNSEGTWEKYTGEKFVAGVWRYTAKLDVDTGVPKTHQLDENITANFSGYKWTHSEILNSEEVSLTWLNSPEITLEEGAIEQVTVTFESEHGVTPAAQTIKKGTKLVKPANPVDEYFDFSAWMIRDKDDPDTLISFSFDTPIEEDMTVIALWFPKPVDVTFKIGDDDSEVYLVSKGETIKQMPSAPLIKGQHFTGWFTEKEGGEKFDFNTLITTPITLYGQYEKITATTKFSIEIRSAGIQAGDHILMENLGGTAKVDKSEAVIDEPIKITITPDKDYQIYAVEINNEKLSQSELAKIKANGYLETKVIDQDLKILVVFISISITPDPETPTPDPEKPTPKPETPVNPTNKWVETENGEWIRYDANSNVATNWYQEGSHWYYFNAAGIMQTGWINVAGKWYSMRENGQMKRGWEVIDGKNYFFRKNGEMATSEWIPYGEDWYYIKSSGAMAQNEWETYKGAWYYFKADGKMATNETINGYQVDASGRAV